MKISFRFISLINTSLLWIFLISMMSIEFHEVKFSKIGEIECAVLPRQRILPVNPRIYNFKGTVYLTYYDYETQYLFLNQLSSSGKVVRMDTISLHLSFRRGYQNLMNYCLISPESLLVSYNTSTQKFGTHDSSIVLISSKGEFLSTFNLNEANVTTWNKVPNGALSKVPLRSKYPYYLNNIKLPLIFDSRKNSIIITLARFQFDSPDVQQRKSELGVAFLDGKPFQYIKQTDLFECNSNLYYGMNTHYLRGCFNTETSELVIGTGNSSTLIVIDTNFQGRKVRIKSESLDTIYPLLTPYKEYNDFNQGEFLNIIYDPFDNQYFRMMRVGNNRFSIKSGLPPKRREDNETFVCQILNMNLESKGEGIIVPEYGYPIPYSKGKVLFFNKVQSKLKGRLVFDICKINYLKTDTSNYHYQLKETLQANKVASALNYSEYVKSLINSVYKYYFIINMENTCNSCKNAFVTYYLAHQEALEKNSNVAIVLLTSNLKKEKAVFGFEKLPNHFFIDDKGIHEAFVGTSEHISWLTQNEGDPLVQFFQPEEMHDLYKKLSELLK